ncbi:MAG: 30S ribosomal protein S20 [Aquificaceae bacterium]
MPNTKQAEKRMRRDAKRRLRNRYHLSKMRTYIKKFRKMVESSRLQEAQGFLPKVIGVIYHTAGKGVIHKKEAARRASKVTTLLNKALQKVQG